MTVDGRNWMQKDTAELEYDCSTMFFVIIMYENCLFKLMKGKYKQTR